MVGTRKEPRGPREWNRGSAASTCRIGVLTGTEVATRGSIEASRYLRLLSLIFSGVAFVSILNILINHESKLSLITLYKQL